MIFLFSLKGVLSVPIPDGGGSGYPVSSCGVLSVSNTTYYLTADIIDYQNSTCIEITGSGITLDCLGHKIDGIDAPNSKGIYIRANNVKIFNCVVSDWYSGLFFSSGYAYVENVSAVSNYDGFYLPVSSYNSIRLSEARENDKGAFLIANSNFNTLEKMSLKNNRYGIYVDSSASNVLDGITSKNDYQAIIFRFSSNNTLKNSIVENSSYAGISIYYTGNLPNLIFNNLFNSSYNFYLYSTSLNHWNTTKQYGQRIYTSGLLGGNYWTNPSKTGYSDTCQDSNKDGFCDSPYVLNLNNTDYLPYTVQAQPSCIVCPWVQTLSLIPNIPIPDGGGSWYEFCCSDDNKCAGGTNSCGNLDCYADPLCNNKAKDEFTGFCDRGNPYLKDKCGNYCGVVDSNVCCDSGLLDSRCAGAQINTQGNCSLGYVCNSTCQCQQLPPCDQYDKGYPDITTTPAKCQGFDYSFSSANQMRDYSGIYPSCTCEVTYDSWIEEVSVNGITAGEVSVPQDEIINVIIKVKNTGKKDQANWFVGIEFYYEDYTNPLRDNSSEKKPVYLYYQRNPLSHGCSFPQNCNLGDCKFVEENMVRDGIFNPGETLTLKCWVNASYWPVSEGNNRVMIFVHERDLTQDAGNNGNSGNDWWADALARTTGLNEAANLTVRIKEAIPIKEVNYTQEVTKNAFVNISWKLTEKLANCVLYPCHTNVHYFYSDSVPSASNLSAWVDPEKFGGHNTTPIYQNYTVYNASFLAKVYGNYYFRVYLWNNDRYALSDIFGVRVKRIVRGCTFTPSSNVSVGPTSLNLRISLFGFDEFPSNITVKCSQDDRGQVIPVNNTRAEITCDYPEVNVQTNYTASVLLDDPYFTPCYSNITINPKPEGCVISSFSLKGETSSSSQVFPGESIIATLNGNNCEGERIIIKDQNGQEKCSCTFSRNECKNSSCFVSPSQLGNYRYNAYLNRTVVGTAFIEVVEVQTTYCGDESCGDEENYTTCPQDCLLPEIDALNSSLEDLEEKMSEMGSRVNDLWSELQSIKTILSEARSYYYSGDYQQAISNYSEAKSLFDSLKEEVERRKTEAGGIPWTLIVVVLIVVFGGVVVFFLFKRFGWEKSKWERLKKKWSTYY
ncbi:MAG: NosD domain-containing protein [Candidatus Aenigmatarchaeota archaeon]